MKAPVIILSLALSTSALGVECTGFLHAIDHLDQVGKRMLVWREAWALSQEAEERIHEGHPAVIEYRAHLLDYGIAHERTQAHVDDVLSDIENLVALDDPAVQDEMASLLNEVMAAVARADELTRNDPFPNPESFRLRSEAEIRFLRSLYALVCR